jgi:hypothetical protein
MKTNIRDYIKVFDNKYFSKKECELIINSLGTFKKHTFYSVKNNHKEEIGNDPQISFLKDNKIESIGKLIKDKWFKIIGEYILNELNKKEKIDWFTGWNGYSFPKFIKYNEGTSMRNHCDHIYGLFQANGKARGVPTLSVITALNNSFSGGEIIMCEKYKYPLKTGETIMFPSNFLYPHEIKKITKGTRYSMTSWVY